MADRLLLLLPLIVATVRSCTYLPNDVIRSIPENASVGTMLPIVVKNASFLSTDNFFLTSESPKPFPFQYLSANITLNLTTELDREVHPVYTMQLECHQGGTKMKSMLVIVRLLDIDDTSPVWDPPGHYSVSIKEGNKKNSPLVFGSPRPRISDKDEFTSQQFRMSIVPGPFSNYFVVTNPTTSAPDINVIKTLDYEERNEYNITLKFEDLDLTGRVMFSGTATLSVKVNDVEDEPPKFGQSRYWVVMTANATRGRVLELDPEALRATDGDATLNAPINYELYSTTGGIVNVNTTTGALALSRDNPSPGSYNVYVKAFEVGAPKRSTIVEVQINITSTSLVPVCRQPVVSVPVPEDTKVGTTLANIDVNFPDISQVSYAVETNTAMFSVSGPQLKLKQILDFEAKKLFDVTIRLSTTTQTSTCLYKIQVTDVNDNSPEFLKNSYAFKADSQASIGTIIGSVQALDKDANSKVTYSISSTLRIFSVDKNSGEVKINTSSVLSEKSYSFLVVAADNGSPARRGQVLVTVSVEQAAVVSSANTLVIAMATLGGLLIFVLVVAAIIFFLYRKRSPKRSPTSVETPTAHADNLYFYENQRESDQAWTNMPSPLEAMYKEYCTKDPGTPEGRTSGQADEDGPCVNLGTEFSTGPGSIRSVVSGRSRQRIVPTPVVDSPAELSEVEGSIESYSINHDTPPSTIVRSPQPHFDNMAYIM